MQEQDKKQEKQPAGVNQSDNFPQKAGDVNDDDISLRDGYEEGRASQKQSPEPSVTEHGRSRE